jgi:hypothetical protein
MLVMKPVSLAADCPRGTPKEPTEMPSGLLICYSSPIW